MPRELYCNNVPTILSAAVTTIGQTTFSVTSGLDFPKVGNFRILIGTELCLVTAVVQNSFVPATWTVTRAIEGTTATTHVSGKRIDFLVTKNSLLNLYSDSTRAGGIANTISPPRLGDLYFPQDSLYTMMAYNGNAWQYFHTGMKCTVPSTSTFPFSEITDSGFSATTSEKYLTLFDTASAGPLQSLYRPAPSTPYIMTMAMLPQTLGVSYGQVGMGWRSVTGQWVTFSTGAFNGAVFNHRITKWNSTLSYNSDYTQNNAYPSFMHGPLTWMRITDNGTTRSCWGSSTGKNWTVLHSIGRTDFFTPTSIGLISGDTTANIGMHVLHLEIT